MVWFASLWSLVEKPSLDYDAEFSSLATWLPHPSRRLPEMFAEFFQLSTIFPAIPLVSGVGNPTPWWREWFGWSDTLGPVVAGILIVVCCVLSWATNLISVPGNWISVALLALYVWLGPEEGRAMMGGTTLVIAFGLALLGEIIEFVAGAAGARRAGASRRATTFAMVGSIVGAVVGAVVGLPVPVFGSVLAAMLFGGLGATAGRDVWALHRRQTLAGELGDRPCRLLGTHAGNGRETAGRVVHRGRGDRGRGGLKTIASSGNSVDADALVFLPCDKQSLREFYLKSAGHGCHTDDGQRTVGDGYCTRPIAPTTNRRRQPADAPHAACAKPGALRRLTGLRSIADSGGVGFHLSPSNAAH